MGEGETVESGFRGCLLWLFCDSVEMLPISWSIWLPVSFKYIDRVPTALRTSSRFFVKDQQVMGPASCFRY